MDHHALFSVRVGADMEQSGQLKALEDRGVIVQVDG